MSVLLSLNFESKVFESVALAKSPGGKKATTQFHTCQKPQRNKPAPRRWCRQHRTPSWPSDLCLCPQQWRPPHSPFPLLSSQRLQAARQIFNTEPSPLSSQLFQHLQHPKEQVYKWTGTSPSLPPPVPGPSLTPPSASFPVTGIGQARGHWSGKDPRHRPAKLTK